MTDHTGVLGTLGSLVSTLVLFVTGGEPSGTGRHARDPDFGGHAPGGGHGGGGGGDGGGGSGP